MNKHSLADRRTIFDAVDRIHKANSHEYAKLCKLIADYADRGYTLSTVVELAEKWARGLEASK